MRARQLDEARHYLLDDRGSTRGYVARLKRLDWSDNSREYTKTNDSKYVLIVWLAAVDCRDAQTLLTTCESSQRPKTRAKDFHDIRYTRNSPEKGTHTHTGVAPRFRGERQARRGRAGLVDLATHTGRILNFCVSLPLGYGGGSTSSHISLVHRSTHRIESQRERKARTCRAERVSSRGDRQAEEGATGRQRRLTWRTKKRSSRAGPATSRPSPAALQRNRLQRQRQQEQGLGEWQQHRCPVFADVPPIPPPCCCC